TRVPIARRRRALGDRGQGVAARHVRRPVRTRPRHAIPGLTSGLLLASAAPGRAQTIYAPETTDRYFQVEFDVTRNRKGPAVEGYVYNRGRTAAQRVRLQIQRDDAAGSVVRTSTPWVHGDAPMDARAFFSASVPEPARSRVTVVPYDWACPGGRRCMQPRFGLA